MRTPEGEFPSFDFLRIRLLLAIWQCLVVRPHYAVGTPDVVPALVHGPDDREHFFVARRPAPLDLCQGFTVETYGSLDALLDLD